MEINIPGVEEQKLQIDTKGNMLHVAAVVQKDVENKDKNYMHKERYWQKFERAFRLPDDADLSAMKSDYKDGVLKIVVPKKG